MTHLQIRRFFGRFGVLTRDAEKPERSLDESTGDSVGAAMSFASNPVDGGDSGGQPGWEGVIEPVAGVLATESTTIDPEAARAALAPTLWLLERANEGIRLTQTGALNRAFVREAAERWPGWWAAEVFGPPHREADVTPLLEIDGLLRAVRLIRRTGSRVASTKKGRAIQSRPPALLQILVSGLFEGDTFGTACAELAAALLIAGVKADYSDAIPERIRPTLVAEGWQAGGEPPDVRDIGLSVAAFLRQAEAVGLFEPRKDGRGVPPSRMVLRDIGRAALLTSLHARIATSPGRR